LFVALAAIPFAILVLFGAIGFLAKADRVASFESLHFNRHKLETLLNKIFFRLHD
jgi:hypothetical protein